MGTVQQAGLSTQHFSFRGGACSLSRAMLHLKNSHHWCEKLPGAISTYSVAIRQLMAAPEKPPKKIGFQLKEKRAA
jgi:hypothetical protein